LKQREGQRHAGQCKRKKPSERQDKMSRSPAH